jgi:hypothetical protein
MGIDKSLSDNFPSVIIGGTRYHYGRRPGSGEYLVENADYAKDYWCFKSEDDLVAFLVNLPESADRGRRLSLHPDWHEVTAAQRRAYIEEDDARLRAQAAAKREAGTAPTFNMDLDGRAGPHAPQRPDGASTAAGRARDIADAYWAERVELRDHPASVRVGGVQYFALPEDGTSPFRGHGGAEFLIKFGDGRLVRSTNVWQSGEVPKACRGQLPDNAEFVSRDEFRRLIAEKAALERTAGGRREGRGPSERASPIGEGPGRPDSARGPEQGPKHRQKKGQGQGL